MKKFLLLTILLGLLAACGSDKESNSPPEVPVKSVEYESDSEKVESNDAVEVSEESEEANASTETTETVGIESPNTSVELSTENSVLKDQYLSELDAIEQEIANMPEGETQIGMEEIAGVTYKLWDDALNKVWKELEKQLPTEEMDKLREEQRRWIKHKYEVSSKEAAEYEGGTMESLVKVSTQAQVTKDRCYELVEKYM